MSFIRHYILYVVYTVLQTHEFCFTRFCGAAPHVCITVTRVVSRWFIGNPKRLFAVQRKRLIKFHGTNGPHAFSPAMTAHRSITAVILFRTIKGVREAPGCYIYTYFPPPLDSIQHFLFSLSLSSSYNHNWITTNHSASIRSSADVGNNIVCCGSGFFSHRIVVFVEHVSFKS